MFLVHLNEKYLGTRPNQEKDLFDAISDGTMDLGFGKRLQIEESTHLKDLFTELEQIKWKEDHFKGNTFFQGLITCFLKFHIYSDEDITTITSKTSLNIDNVNSHNCTQDEYYIMAVYKVTSIWYYRHNYLGSSTRITRHVCSFQCHLFYSGCCLM